MLKETKLQGSRWLITTNLEAALRYLRDPEKEKAVWIDAICINQSDVEERNAQVHFMKKVYSKTMYVRVWLGEAADDSDMAIGVVK